MTPESFRDLLVSSRADIRRSDNHIYSVRQQQEWKVYTGTTTCIDRHMPKPWLGPWYAKEAALEATSRILALEELALKPVLTIIEESKGAAGRKSNRAKDRGTDLHSLAEWWSRAQLGAEEEMPSLDSPEMEVAWPALREWLEAHVTPLLPEQPVYSRVFRYAGTVDLVGVVDGEVEILDFKTSGKKAYLKPEYVLQLHAYCGAIHEMTGQRPGMRVVVLPKDKPRPAKDFLVPWDQGAYTAFLGLLEAHRWTQGIPDASA